MVYQQQLSYVHQLKYALVNKHNNVSNDVIAAKNPNTTFLPNFFNFESNT